MEESELPGRLFRLPFEFNDNDKLGPWDILLSEGTIKDIREILLNEDVEDMQLESPLTIELIMKKLGQISSGAWDKYELQSNASSHTIPVYEVEVRLPHKQFKILWQVDHGFSIRNHSLSQLVKVWAITDSQEKIDATLDILTSVHKVYTSEHTRRCRTRQMGKDNVVLPKYFEDKERTKSTDEGLYSIEMDDEIMLDVHKMLVTNKFVPLSKNLFKSLILSGLEFTFQVSKIEYEIINNPTSAIVIGRSGTGKTTCILFRLLASYLANNLYKTPYLHGNDENFHKRQLFITVSYTLCRKVKKYFDQLRNSAELAEKKISRSEFIEWKRKEGNGG